MASRTRPMSSCPPMVFLTPISTLSKSMNTAIRLLRLSVVTFIGLSRVWRRSVELLRVGLICEACFSICHDTGLLGIERRRVFHVGRYHPRKLPPLEQFPSFAAPAGNLVLRGADRLLAAPAGFHPHQVPVAQRRHEPQHVVLLPRQFDQDDPLARA